MSLVSIGATDEKGMINGSMLANHLSKVTGGYLNV